MSPSTRRTRAAGRTRRPASRQGRARPRRTARSRSGRASRTTFGYSGRLGSRSGFSGRRNRDGRDGARALPRRRVPPCSSRPVACRFAVDRARSRRSSSACVQSPRALRHSSMRAWSSCVRATNGRAPIRSFICSAPLEVLRRFFEPAWRFARVPSGRPTESSTRPPGGRRRSATVGQEELVKRSGGLGVIEQRAGLGEQADADQPFLVDVPVGEIAGGELAHEGLGLRGAVSVGVDVSEDSSVHERRGKLVRVVLDLALEAGERPARDAA